MAIQAKILAVIGLISLVCLAGIEGNPLSRIDIKLLKSLENDQTANILIEMSEGVSSPLAKLQSEKHLSRSDRLEQGAKLLQTHAENSQYLVKSFLQESQIKYKSFWISNQIYIQGASLSLVKKLANFAQISKIIEEPIVELETPVVSRGSNVRLPNTPRATQWGVSKIQADRVWELVGGTTGEGIVVGGIDTGVRSTHQDLRGNFRSSYGWRDPVSNSSLPNDDGFGTHAMGVIVGANGIGVAPGAKWIACKGCGSFSCSSSHLIECGEFMLCPTLANGTSPNCTQAPNVVSNSWGGAAGSASWFDRVIDSWVAVGIVPFFPVGGSGGCSTVGSPADGNVIGVGSTTANDSLASSSSQGPNSRGQIKPDVSAPGTNILSASPNGDDAYITLSGSSMASHHAAGTGALILAARQLPYQEFKSALLNSSDTTGLVGPGTNCGGISESQFPNNAFGYGRINAYRSVVSVINSTELISH